VTADSGQPYGNLVGYKWQRDAAGHIVVGSDGLPIRDASQQVLGNYNPDWVAGISNTIRLQAHEFSFSFDGQVGGSCVLGHEMVGQYSGVLASTLAGGSSTGIIRATSCRTPCTPTVSPTRRMCWRRTTGTTHVLRAGAWPSSTRRSSSCAKLACVRAAAVGRTLPWLLGRDCGRRRGATCSCSQAVDHRSRDRVRHEHRQGVENGQLPTARSIGFTMSVRP